MKSENIITKAMALAICVLFLAAMSAVCIASTTTYSVPIGTGAADLADNNLASAYTGEFATGYTASVAGWSEDIRLTSDSAYSGSPEIAVDTNNNVHITWYDERDGNYEIYYTKLDNTGNTLVDDTRLTSDSASSGSPEIAVDTTNYVHITWNDERDGNREIYYTKLDNTGNTLVDDTRLTSDSASSGSPEIAVDTTNYVHITWNDERDGNREIYYTKLDNTGNTLVDDTRLTSDSAFSVLPKIAVDTNNNVHITWYDKRDGNYEIYYKHSIGLTPTATAGPTPTTPTTPTANCIYFNTGAWTNLSSVFINGTEIYGGTNNTYNGTAYMYLWLSFDSASPEISLRPCPDDIDPQTGEPNWGDRAGLAIEEISSTELRSRLTADFVPYELRAGLKGPYIYRSIVTAPDHGYHSSYIFSFDTPPNYAIGWGNVDAYDWLARVRVCNLG